MLPVTNAATFALAALALIVIPGPSVLFVIGRSLSLGRKGGFLSVLGNALGLLPGIAAVSLGVAAIVAESVVVFTVVKFVGAVYLIYLGIQAIRHRSASTDAAMPRAQLSTFRLLREGFVVGVSNPKTLVFFVAILPQFVDYSSGAIPTQLFVLGMIFIVIALASDGAWAWTACAARQWFDSSPRRLSLMGAGGGVMMILLGGVLLIAGNET